MEIKEIIQGVGEYLLPQFRELSERLDRLEGNYREMRSLQEEMSRRIGDLNLALNARMDSIENSLNRRMDNIEKRIGNIERRLDFMDQRIDSVNQRLDNLYQVVVRRDEHQILEQRVGKIEEEIRIIKQKMVA